jgi:hypothetical protein
MITRSTLKKALVWVVMLMMLVPLLTSMVPETYASGSSIMYVKTSNGKSIKIYSEPSKKSSNIGRVGYGDAVEVDWSYAGNDGWSRILLGVAGHPYGYIQTRYLTDKDPGPYKKPTKAPKTPKPTKDPKKEAEELKKQQEELNKELKSEKEVTPYYITVNPTRASGWINFRVGPSTITSKITSYPANKELIVLGETKTWLRAKDPDTGKIGYIYKKYTAKLNKQVVVAEEAAGTEKLGKLSVNGEFEITCKLPQDYKLQVVDVRGENIIASVTSEDITKPQMYLSIAYDELYGEVERMNDLSDEELAVLEDSFKEMDQVEIEYRQTGLGTKLMVVREVGNGQKFIDILSVYKGYFVEFNMTPNPNAAVQDLTEEQIQIAIQFLTDVMFEPVKK